MSTHILTYQNDRLDGSRETFPTFPIRQRLPPPFLRMDEYSTLQDSGFIEYH